jgi:hypothetical protein
MRLVAVPADTDPYVVFCAKHLLDTGSRTAECFDCRNNVRQPSWDWFGFQQLPQIVIVSKTERSDAPLALELAKLKGLKR